MSISYLVTPNLVNTPVRVTILNRNQYSTSLTFPISDTFAPGNYTVIATTIFNRNNARTNTVEAILNVA